MRGPALDRQLRALIDEHADAVYHLALGILRDPGLAEDVVQDTMIKAWRGLGEFRGDSSTRTWILRIAHHTAIDVVRRRRDRPLAPEDLPDHSASGAEAADPATRATARDELGALGAALAELDDLSRSIVVLREVEGLTYEEISRTLDVSTAVVKTRLLRARRALVAAVRPSEED